MTALSPAMDAALASGRTLVTLLIEVNLPDIGFGAYDLRLLAGSGFAPWGAKLFRGEDDFFGTLAAIDAIEDGDGDQAPALGFSMYPNGVVSAARLSSALYQHAPVNLWMAAIERSSGLVYSDPLNIFSGFVDQTTLKAGKGTREVDFQCVSQFDLLLEDDEGARLSDSFHQSIWPGETGCANVTGLTEQRYWGLATPRSGAVVAGYQGGPLANLNLSGLAKV